MATAGQWFQGARPKTLPAALAPVVAGTAVSAWEAHIAWLEAFACLVVAVALQVGVNYANDYSDGIRGTDDARVGPVRLVGQQLAPAKQVKSAAFASLGVGALAGLALIVMTGMWWLLGIGAAAIAAAWLYTGGPRPYGYAGLGEVFVFVFFGLVAVCGTSLVQSGWISPLSVFMGVSMGALSCAILVANNLRDIVGDRLSGKMTLAVRLGDGRTRALYASLVGIALVIPVVVTALGFFVAWPTGAGLGSIGAVLVVGPAVHAVRSGARGRDLIAVLGRTGKSLLVLAVLFAVGVGLSIAAR